MKKRKKIFNKDVQQEVACPPLNLLEQFTECSHAMFHEQNVTIKPSVKVLK